MGCIHVAVWEADCPSDIAVFVVLAFRRWISECGRWVTCCVGHVWVVGKIQLGVTTVEVLNAHVWTLRRLG
jgi:hypothetical protein